MNHHLSSQRLISVGKRLLDTQKMIAKTRVDMDDLDRLKTDTREIVRLSRKRLAL